MSMRKTFLSVALLGALASPAFAGGAGYVPERGEATYSGPMPGNTTNQLPSGKSRAEVNKELQAFQRNPVTADGYRYVGGEIGYVFDPGDATYSGKSRAEVNKELQAFQRNPVTADGYRYVGGEIGYVSDPGDATYSGKSRAEVNKELQAFQRNPVTADGYRYVGGEVGYVFVGQPAAQD